MRKLILMMGIILLISSALQGAMSMSKPNKQEVEVREVSFSPSDLQDDNTLSGLAISYKNHSEPMYSFLKRIKYKEIILPGACTESITSRDVKCLHQHDNKFVLGRTQNNTLELTEEIEGLFFKVSIPDTTWAIDLATSVRRGDIDKMSFGFIPLEEEWLDDEATLSEYGMPVREISKLELREISIVSNPAYSSTAVRELDETLEEGQENVDNTNKEIDVRSEVVARKIAMLKTRI